MFFVGQTIKSLELGRGIFVGSMINTIFYTFSIIFGFFSGFDLHLSICQRKQQYKRKKKAGLI